MWRIFTILSIVIMIGCKGNENKQVDIANDSTESTINKSEYTCPMHPEIVTDTPSQCSRCGMELQIRS